MKNVALLKNIAQIRKRVSDKSSKTPISSKPVTIVAASKSQPIELLRDAAESGIRNFGENYLQEALPKMELLQNLNLTWHFIGPLQSNKAKGVAERFDWIHSVDRLSIAKRLSEKRPVHLKPLNVCLQVNISNESSKSGCRPTETLKLIKEVHTLPHILLRGLMVIPEAIRTRDDSATSFAETRELFELSKTLVPTLDTLSMGMSDDFELAIEHGSTMVRLGTALFGARNR